MASNETVATHKKLNDLYELIDDIEIALMTTRRSDGRLVTRPMATQDQGPLGDLWFVTNIETDKVDELEFDPNVCLGYCDNSSKAWVSVSGTAEISQDRARIRELHEDHWKAYFGDEGGDRDGGPDDPRLALIFVDAVSVTYMKSESSKPQVLFELAKGMVTGDQVELGQKEELTPAELGAATPA